MGLKKDGFDRVNAFMALVTSVCDAVCEILMMWFLLNNCSCLCSGLDDLLIAR